MGKTPNPKRQAPDKFQARGDTKSLRANSRRFPNLVVPGSGTQLHIGAVMIHIRQLCVGRPRRFEHHEHSHCSEKEVELLG